VYRRASKRTIGGCRCQRRRFILLLATHGWWPWLLLYAAMIAIVAYAVVFLVKRRRVG